MGVLTLAISAVLLIFIVLGLKSNIAALQTELSTLQQNFSWLSKDLNITASEDLMELRQDYLQVLRVIDHNFEFQQSEAEELSENNSLLYSEVQQLKSELECVFITTSCSDLLPPGTI